MYIALIGVIILLTLPLQAAIALAVLLTSGPPVIFRQKRIGKNGRIFTLYKFRTMVPDAERRKQKLRGENEATGPAFKIRNDPRFTAIGKILSHTGLDELPQLYNMVKGDMVFFGPRPLPVAEAKKLTSWMRVRETVLPGVISPAILTGKYHKDFNAWMKSDAVYVLHKSVTHDIGLFFRLIPFAAGMVWRGVFGGR